MNEILFELESWFTKRPLWFQDAARRIIQKGAIDDSDFSELITLCKQEAGIRDSSTPTVKPLSIPEGALQGGNHRITLRLEAISNVKGINALKPRKSLEFGTGPLTIVYGANGSGKSGYVRALKHACGARKAGALLGNIFDQYEIEKGCKFNINVDTVSKEICWSPQMGVLDDIKTIEIYDTDCAHVYLTAENEVAYEPWALSLFTQLTTISTEVGQVIKQEIDRSISIKPPLPSQYSHTDNGLWYTNLTHQTRQSEVGSNCTWNEQLDSRMKELNERLAEPSPTKRAKTLRKVKENLVLLHNELQKLRAKVSAEKCATFLSARQDASAKRKAANDDAKKVFDNAPLEGVGSESWRLLWEQARAYSETIAYMGIPFPNITAGARCILCQQLLDSEAQQRFKSFEDFVKGALQKQANEAEQQFKAIVDDIREILSEENLILRLDAAQIIAEEERNQIVLYRKSIENRKDSLLTAKSLSDIKPLPDAQLLKRLENRYSDMEKQAAIFEEDAKSQNRSGLQKQVKELETQKWLSEQKNTIEKEIDRLKHLYKLEKARKLTNTQPLSKKKSILADEMVSPAFIERFENELKALGASRIQVEFKKTKTEYGRVYHKIHLRNCTKNICTTDILSEGEFRIVSLAAFLADVEGQADNTPFVFDDPISSLDQDFEEATAQRLIDLCRTRQVIVFTHRLSLLSLLQDATKRAGIDPHIICLRSESWGLGEPGETPIFARKPDNALKSILNERIPKARSVLMEAGRTEYELLAKGICSDIRILIERLIENDLLADVVQRFRRSVQTMNKIGELAKINSDDCKLIDEYMTKYSKYEHSQSLETPVSIPAPDELKNDIEKILAWVNDFKNRSA